MSAAFDRHVAAHAAALAESKRARALERANESFGYCMGPWWDNNNIFRCSQSEAVSVLTGRVQESRLLGKRIVVVAAPVGVVCADMD